MPTYLNLYFFSRFKLQVANNLQFFLEAIKLLEKSCLTSILFANFFCSIKTDEHDAFELRICNRICVCA